MQAEYLARLSPSLQQFVREVEQHSGMYVNVLLDAKLDTRGPSAEGLLAIEINHRRIRLFAPTHGYFPEGGVRHELLHVQRICVQGIARLKLADEEHWDEDFHSELSDLDNALEHLAIVPVELQFHPERLGHWESIMEGVCLALLRESKADHSLAGCLHWTFLRHLLPDSPSVETLRRYLHQHELLEKANAFSKQILTSLDSKEKMIGVVCSFFPHFPIGRVGFDYFRSY